MTERKDLVHFKEMPVTLVGDEIKVGDKAPDFVALNQDLSEFKLSDLEGKIKIISVAPSLDTGVCATQTTRFNEEAKKVSDNVEIVTVTVDLPFAQRRFCEHLSGSKMHVVSDHKDLDFGHKYGLVMKELRLLARAVLVVDENDVVQYIDVNSQIAEEPDYDKALEVVKNLA